MIKKHLTKAILKILNICLLGIICSLSISAQISPLYEKYFNYEQFINPAITGRDIYPIVNLARKQYWLDLKNSPSTTCLGASMRLGNFDFYNPRKMINRSGFTSKARMGFGALVMNETDGPLSSFLATVSYAYFAPLGYGRELSFGISTQFLNYSINRSVLHPIDPNDPELLNIESKTIFPEFGLGMYYHDNQFFFGTSVNDLLNSKKAYDQQNQTANKRDYFFQTGYKFFLKYFELEPSVYVTQIDDQPLFYSGQVKLYYLYYHWIALSYRSSKSVFLSVGFNIRRFYLAYAYEHSISSMGSYYSGSHEIMIGLNIGLYQAQGIRKRVSD